MVIGSEGLAGPLYGGGQCIAGVATLLKYGLRCVVWVDVVGSIDGQALLGSGVGFGQGSTFVFCPGDMLIDEGVFMELSEATCFAFESFALRLVFEVAGNWSGRCRV